MTYNNNINVYIWDMAIKCLVFIDVMITPYWNGTDGQYSDNVLVEVYDDVGKHWSDGRALLIL